MPANSELVLQNTLLSALNRADFELLKLKFEVVEISLGEVLCEANQVLEHAYFPLSGICSIIAQNDNGIQIETGLIGREGFVGTPLVLDVDRTPSKVVVQAGGRAARISRKKFLNALKKSPSLHRMLLRFAHTFSVQISQTAVANSHHTISQRLARWLLMCQDRVDTPEFPMTHKFLSVMLAVRRAGITEAMNYLEGKKAIRSKRERIVIANRAILEGIAGEAYGVPEREYRRVIA